jgi:hypothetical protein
MTHEEKAYEEAKRNRMYAKLYGPNQRWQDGLDALAYAWANAHFRLKSDSRKPLDSNDLILL